MTETLLSFLLMGKTGHGKSSVGNTLLNKQCFNTYSSCTSGTKEVEFNAANFNRYLLNVVDVPGLEDTDIDKAQDKELAVKHMDKALAMCYGSVDAFLFVFKFGHKFTHEEKSTLESLKRIFGPTYFNHLIVIMTCGDLFHQEMKEAGEPQRFHEWCINQKGEIRNLYTECNERFVLFNNKEKNEGEKCKQQHRVVQLAHDLQKKFGRYISENFKKAEKERQKMIIELKAPILKLEIQVAICLLTGELEKFRENPRDEEKQNIVSRVEELKRKIEDVDKGLGLLRDLMKLVEDVENNLHNRIELQRLARELEEIRSAKKIWGCIGIGCVVIGTGIAGISAAPVIVGAAVFGTVATGAAVALSGGTTGAVMYSELYFREKLNENNQSMLKKNTLKNQPQ